MSSVHHIWRPQRDQPSPEVGIGCAKWERLPRNVTVSVRHSGGVCFPGETPPPRPSYGGTLRSTFSPSLSVLLGRVSSLGNRGKGPSPLQLYGRQSEETQRPGRGLYCTASATWVELDFSAFSFFLSLNANTLFQDLTSLRGGPRTAGGKESLSSSHKRCSGRGTPRCHPKAGDATF
jgi:hypothetical protein